MNVSSSVGLVSPSLRSWANGRSGLLAKSDKMGKAVVKGVPHVAYTTGLSTWHAEAVPISSKVPKLMLESIKAGRSRGDYLWEGGHE
jgi:hypothetical protein